MRFAVEGTPVGVPTDSGLTDRFVSRDHYQSVKPVQPEPGEPPDQRPTTSGSPSSR